jgi:RNA polymerase sigma-70 factor (ECF subfamily)
MLAVKSYHESEGKISINKSNRASRFVDITEMEKQRKKKQFEELFIPLLDRLYNMITRNTSDAEDLVQKTYLKAYRFYHSFKENTNERAWLITIMMNTFRSDYRKARLEPATVEFDSVEHLTQTEGHKKPDLPANKSEIREAENLNEYLESIVSDEVLKALDAVPARYRMPVLLSDAEKFNYQEISEILGISLGTVKSRIFRGRGILKKNLYNFAVSRGIIRK